LQTSGWLPDPFHQLLTAAKRSPRLTGDLEDAQGYSTFHEELGLATTEYARVFQTRIGRMLAMSFTTSWQGLPNSGKNIEPGLTGMAMSNFWF
jgi:hypothetical protein